MTHELRLGIKEKYLSEGSFPVAASSPREHLYQRIVGGSTANPLEFGEYLFSLIPSGTLDVQFPHLTPKLLPSPEPESIIQTLPYVRARAHYRAAPAIVIVGYSFGKSVDGLDDFASWQYFVDLLKHNPPTRYRYSFSIPFP